MLLQLLLLLLAELQSLPLAKTLPILLGLQLLPVWMLCAAGTATAGFAFVFATQASILCFCRSCLHALVLVHAQRIGAGEVNVFVVSSVSKTNLVQVHVVTHSWYCARKRVAARPGRETALWHLHPCCVPFDFSRNTKIFSDSLNLKSFFCHIPSENKVIYAF
jgi:hypothetical protein